MPDRTLAETYAQQIGRRLDNVAAKLRDLADRTERAAQQARNVPNHTPPQALPTYGNATFTGVVGDVQHTILWGLANLQLSELTRDAAEADLARAQDTTNE